MRKEGKMQRGTNRERKETEGGRKQRDLKETPREEGNIKSKEGNMEREEGNTQRGEGNIENHRKTEISKCFCYIIICPNTDIHQGKRERSQQLHGVKC